jgi:dTDP-4-amino-4,6-dideoxy-D-glucose acyltransferase
MPYDPALLQKIGEDVFVSQNVEIRRPHLVSLGNHVAIDTGFYITTRAEIGDYVHIAPYVTVIGGADAFFKVGNFSGISAGCRIVCATDAYLGEGLTSCIIPDQYRDRVINEPVIIDDFAAIGTNVVIMPGVTIGEGCAIGACALVTADTEPWTVYVGIPARPIKIRPKETMLNYARELGY